ncbi:MAG: 16S rRNA processing protein RimM [Clostridia bacterium]|nr:16S rRNA processing protein RimM [Clostridia bacterium]
MLKDYLSVGQIVGTHGVRGEMRVQPWSDSPAFLKQFKTLYYDPRGERSVKVVSARVHGNVVLVTLEGVDTMEKAQAMRNTVLYMRRADARLPEGFYFVDELCGCSVFDADTGAPYGVITAVTPTGANDVWHVEKDGREYLFPAVAAFLGEVDVAAGRVTVRPIKGIFDEAENAD